jgi:hypothetical protein
LGSFVQFLAGVKWYKGRHCGVGVVSACAKTAGVQMSKNKYTSKKFFMVKELNRYFSASIHSCY